MYHAASADLVCFKQLLEEQNDLEEEACYAALMAVTAAIFCTIITAKLTLLAVTIKSMS